MKKNMTLGIATDEDLRNIIFNGDEHKEFLIDNFIRCRTLDEYHMALIYCLGIDRDTRAHVNSIYDFQTGYVKTTCLQEGWLTSGSAKIVRMAFNLYCNGTPSTCDYENLESQVSECREYTVENLFCCGYARFFWQAIKIRYPEYTAR